MTGCLVNEVRLIQIEMYYYFEVFSHFSGRKSRSRFVTSQVILVLKTKNLTMTKANPYVDPARGHFFGGGGGGGVGGGH